MWPREMARVHAIVDRPDRTARLDDFLTGFVTGQLSSFFRRFDLDCSNLPDSHRDLLLFFHFHHFLRTYVLHNFSLKFPLETCV